MKKTLLYLAGAAALLVGCAKEVVVEEPTTPGAKTITIQASIAPETKTTVDINGNKAVYSWEAGETIKVLELKGSNAKYVDFTVSDVANGLFEGQLLDGYELAGAVSPSWAFDTGGLNNGEVFYGLNLDGYYHYGSSNAIMAAATPEVSNNTYKFNFKHITALFKVTYENVPVGTKQLSITTDQPMAGAVGTALTFNSFENAEFIIPNRGQKTIYVTLDEAVTEANQPLTFYAPIPTGTYGSVSVSLQDASGATIDGTTRSKTKSFTATRGHILALPTITLEAKPIVENFSSSGAANNTYACSSSLATASNRADFDFVWTPSGAGTVFTNGIKLGNSSGTGSVTSSSILSDIPAGSSFTVKVYAAAYRTDDGDLVVSYNGSDIDAAPANDPIMETSNEYSASDFALPTTFVFTKTAEAEDLTIASSYLRIFIDKVEIVPGGTPVPVEKLTVTPATENPETVPYTGGEMSYSVYTENIESWDATSSDDNFVVTKNNEGFVVTVAENESSTPKSATITVSGGTKTVNVTINQEGAPAVIETLTIAQFLAKEVGDTYYQLTGKLTALVNTTYGNFTLVDETGSVYVYGLTKTQQTSNDKSFASIGVKEGDYVTLVGKRDVHNDDPQVGGPAYYISHVPAPVITVSPENKTVLANVTEVEIAITSNTDWTITGDGITASPSTGNGNGTATLTFAARTTTGDATLVATVAANIDPTVNATVTITQHGTDYVAPTGWVETDLADIQAGDVFVMVANSAYAIPHDGSSAPVLVGVTVSGSKITGTVASNIQWNLTGNAVDGYTFYPNGNSEKYLYCSTTATSSSNDNLRVGTGNRKVFVLDNGGHIVTNDTYVNRFIGINGTSNFRGYTSATPQNVTEAIFKFYKFFDDGKVDANVSFSPASATIAYGTTLTQPTLTKPDGLVVTFASNNTGVATVNSSGVITVVKPGTATITASWEAQGNYREGSADYVLTVNKGAASVAFNNPVTTVAVNGKQTNVATPTPSSLTVTYSSNNPATATVNASTGEVTGVANGFAVITATVGNDYYETATDSYTITVGSGGSSAQWEVVTDFSSIVSGDRYMFVNVQNSKSYYMSTETCNVGSGTTCVQLSSLPTTLGFVTEDNMILILTGNSTDGYIASNLAGKELFIKNTNNGLGFVETGTRVKFFTNNDVSGYTLSGNDNASTPVLRYVGMNSTTNFRCYTSVNSNVKTGEYVWYHYIGQ